MSNVSIVILGQPPILTRRLYLTADVVGSDTVMDRRFLERQFNCVKARGELGVQIRAGCCVVEGIELTAEVEHPAEVRQRVLNLKP